MLPGTVGLIFSWPIPSPASCYLVAQPVGLSTPTHNTTVPILILAIVYLLCFTLPITPRAISTLEEGPFIMAARSSLSPILTKRDLETCTDIASVFTLFRKLRYPVEALPIHIPFDAGDLPGNLRNGIRGRYLVAQIGGSRPGESPLSVTLFELKGDACKSAIIRGVAQAWTRRFTGEHLLVFTVNDTLGQQLIEQLAFVNTRRLGEGAHQIA